MESSHLEVRGVSIATDRFGDRNHPPVLLVMGAMASGVWWPREFCEALASRGRHVIRYDHRDTGATTAAPGYTTEDLTWDGLALLDALGIGAAHWVGMSLGGYLAQLAAVAHPSRVRSLTLIAAEPLVSSPPKSAGMDPKLLEYHSAAATLDWSNKEAVLDYQVGAWRLLNGSAHPFAESHIRELAEEDFKRTPNPLTAFNHATLKAPAAKWLDRLGELRMPVLIIHGTEDNVVRYENALASHAAFAGSKLLPLTGSGHELHPADWPVMLDAIERHTAQ